MDKFQCTFEYRVDNKPMFNKLNLISSSIETIAYTDLGWDKIVHNFDIKNHFAKGEAIISN